MDIVIENIKSVGEADEVMEYLEKKFEKEPELKCYELLKAVAIHANTLAGWKRYSI